MKMTAIELRNELDQALVAIDLSLVELRALANIKRETLGNKTVKARERVGHFRQEIFSSTANDCS